MAIYEIDPLSDSRWEAFLQSHPGASAFHATAWSRALRNTYGYVPLVLTTSPPTGKITNGLAFCRVRSWLTGTRLVSVPFADHCQPLFNDTQDGHYLAALLPGLLKQEHCDYVEARLLSSDFFECLEDKPSPSTAFVHHSLDLTQKLQTLFDRMHQSCFRRKIKRAEKEGLIYAEGSSDAIVHQFHSLLVMTRRRHGVPPQPLAWFRNLRDSFSDAMRIGVALKNGRPIASMLTLRYKSTLVYKYGCSDAAFHSLGPMPFLFWQTIQRGKAAGATEFDLGRSDTNADGLIAFKNHMGAVAKPLTYYRFASSSATPKFLSRLIQNRRLSAISSHLPGVLLRAAGSFLYRHAG